MSWKINSIRLVNFQCHGDTSIDFVQNHTTLIVGENLDEQDQDNNGSGKSSVLDGISFALTGEVLRKGIVNTEIIKDDEAKGFVFLTLSDNNGNELCIERRISRTASTQCNLLLNGETPPELPGVSDASAYILSKLGLAKNDLLDYVLVSAERYTSFFLSTDGEKKKLIARFSGVNKLDNIFAAIKGDLASAEKILTFTRGQISSIKDQITDANNELQKIHDQKATYLKDAGTKNTIDWDTELALIVERYKERREFLALEIDKIENEKCQKLSAQVEKTEAVIKTFPAKIKKLEDEGTELKNSILEARTIKKEASDKVSTIGSTIAKITQMIHGIITCPKCSHEFFLDKNSTTSPEELRRQKASLEEQQKENNAVIKEVTDLVEELEKEYSSNCHVHIASLKSELAKLNSEKDQYLNELSSLQRQIKSLKDQGTQAKNNEANEVAALEKRKEAVKKASLKDTTKVFDLQIASLEQKIITISEKKAKLEENEQEQLKILETTRQTELCFNKFRVYVINKFLALIQNHINFFLSEYTGSYRVEITGYRTVNKKIKEEIDIVVYRNGKLAGRFSKLSLGEKARMDIAGIRAFHELINSASPSGGLNFLCLDEVIGSLDKKGVTALLKALDNSPITILAITHNAQNVDFQRILKIQKQNGSACCSLMPLN